MIDPDAEKAVFNFGTDYKAALEMTDGRHVLQNQTCLTIMELSGSYWHSERISWDGIKELRLDDDGLVHGIAFDPDYDEGEWAPFTYDTHRKVLVGGSFRDYSVSERKPRWKFWR